ncbi:unnamed protein product [Pedinophyceae sp. YPF-701]|nr:unnamed protein product [Pedinophyceae sp. YPF-701]
MTAPSDPSVLEAEAGRLSNSISHLERSIREIKQAIAEEGPCVEYKEAVGENIVLIAKQKAALAAIEEQIRKAKGADAPIEPQGMEVDGSAEDPHARGDRQPQHGAAPPQGGAGGEGAWM